MAVLPICKLPHPVLRQEAREISDIDGRLQRLVDDMAETMYAAPGLGLAANQVGELQRLIVFDVTHKEGRSRKLQVVINPCIVAPGPVTLKAGQPLRLRYRLITHDGPPHELAAIHR